MWKNTTTLLTILSITTASQALVLEPSPGWYDEPVLVTHGEAAGDVRYTTDGSPVTSEAPLLEDPLNLTEPTALRVREFDGNGTPLGEELFATYIVGLTTTLPIFSVTIDPFHLHDEDTGILENGDQRGREWERPGHMTFIGKDRDEVISIPCGLRVHGRYGNTVKNSFRLYFRSDYGASKFEYKIFENSHVTEWDNLLIRSGSQDSRYSWTMLRNQPINNLFIEHGQLAPAGDFALFLINGEMWGLFNPMEYLDDRYMLNHLGIPRDEGDMIRKEWYPSAREGSTDAYRDFRNFFRENPAETDEILDLYKPLMDFENFKLYQIIQVTAANTDWPQNNWDMVRWRKDGEIWRWVAYDIDMSQGMFSGSSASAPTVEWAFRDTLRHDIATDYEIQLLSTLLIRNLLANPGFRADFLQSWAHHLNTTLSPGEMMARIDEFESYVEDGIPYENAAWEGRLSGRTMSAWRGNVNNLRNFWRDRADHVRSHLISFFELEEMIELEIDPPVSGGTFRVMGVNIDRQDAFPGLYFPELPLVLDVEPAPGYRFVGWGDDLVGEGTEHSLSISPIAGMTISLTFELDPDYDWGAHGFAEPFPLRQGDYLLTHFDENTPAGSYPGNMVFLQTDVQDPTLDDPLFEPYIMAYNLESRSRIAGLGDAGIGIINTSNPQEDGGGYLGGVVLSLDTREIHSASVSFDAGTVLPNSRPYAIRLLGRAIPSDPWETVLNEQGNPVEYTRSGNAGHSLHFGDIQLPSEWMGRSHVQLKWRYYALPTDVTGPRAFLRLDDIQIEAHRSSDFWLIF
ncbi:MAG: CotH kinase family protein [Candidatus Sumerlaeia bacterium]|nr:CotH kinase family protein [Candidatus Sumerlaeia bacterium]